MMRSLLDTKNYISVLLSSIQYSDYVRTIPFELNKFEGI